MSDTFTKTKEPAGEYAEDWKGGTKDMLVGNILEGITATAMPSLMKKFPGKIPSKDIAQSGDDKLQQFLQSLGGGGGDVIDSLLEKFNSNQPTSSIQPYQSLLG